MGMSSKKAPIGYEYNGTVHSGIGLSMDELYRIDIGDKKAWTGSIKKNGSIFIDQYNLFGGKKGEGGIRGTLEVMFGGESQGQNGTLTRYLGRSIPAFRNTVTTVFSGMLAAMNWYPKTWDFYYRRIKAGWPDNTPFYPETIEINLANGQIKAMNPAHILYESYISNTWGAGLPRAMMDDDAYKQVADALYAEGFGLCFEWKATDDLKKLREYVCNHIDAILGTDPKTGKNTIRLIRDDYKVEDLPVFDEDKGLLEIKLQTSNNTETPSQILVKYKDAIAFEERTAYASNPAVAQGQIGRNTETNEYLGIPTGELATRVAYRDLKAKTSGIKSATIKLDRRAYDIINGQPFRIKTKYRANNIDLVVRTTKRKENFLTDGSITMEVVQDVFSTPKVAFMPIPDAPTRPEPLPPVPIIYSRVLEATYRDLALTVDPANLEQTDASSGFIYTVAQSPANQCYSYDIVSRIKGAANFSEAGDTGAWCATALIASDIGYLDTIIHIQDGELLEDVEVGSAALIDDEIVRIDGFDLTNNQLTIGRGCVDTVPTKHNQGSMIWFIDNSETTDGVEYSYGNNVEVKLLPNTFRERLEQEQAEPKAITIQARQGRPYPPGNLKINGVAYPEEVNASTLNITWSSRNRLLQADKLIDTTVSDTGLENQTSYNLLVKYKSIEVAKINGLTATSFQLKIEGGYKDSALLTLNDLTDLSGKSWTASGSALFDNANAKVGNASLKLNGGWIQTTANLEYFSYTEDFTVEAWINVAKSNYGVIVDNYEPNTNSWQFAFSSGRLCFWSTKIGYLYAGTIPLNTWVHVAASRESGVLRLFVNGELAAQYTDTTQYTASTVVAIGAQRGNPSTAYNFYGNINQVRLTKNLARYTTGFTPSTTPYDYEEAKGTMGAVDIELEAVRDGLSSYQKHGYSFKAGGE